MLFVNVYPAVVHDEIRTILLKERAPSLSKVVQRYLFTSVGKEVEVRGVVIGSVRKAECVSTPLPGSSSAPEFVDGRVVETENVWRIRFTVGVDFRQEAYVRRFLPGGDLQVKTTDEIGNLKGESLPSIP